MSGTRDTQLASRPDNIKVARAATARALDTGADRSGEAIQDVVDKFNIPADSLLARMVQDRGIVLMPDHKRATGFMVLEHGKQIGTIPHV